MTERPSAAKIACAASGCYYDGGEHSEDCSLLEITLRRAIWQAETAALERAASVLRVSAYGAQAVAAIERLIEKEPADGE